MNGRTRIMATLRGEAVDRPALNFYEIGGLEMDPNDPDPFNVHNDPSWRPLLDLGKEHTDLVRLRSPVRARSYEAWGDSGSSAAEGIREQIMKTESAVENGSRITRTSLTFAGRTLTSRTRRDPDIDTLWTVEHLLKDVDDLKAYLELPEEFFDEHVDVAPLKEEEASLGDRGVVMVDTEDPLCAAASLFSMEDFLIVAYTERKLLHRLLEKLARHIHARTEKVAREFPGRLWRIYGPEYASEPYLPPALFEEYVVRYAGPMVEAIRKYGGFARVHCHGRIRNILDHIVDMGADAIDPIEPPPFGDVDLEYVRREYGKDIVLFGNLEVTDIENMEPDAFDKVVQMALQDGTAGQGRGFVLMPSSCPLGRKISAKTLQNYETMVRRTCEFKL